MVKKNRWRNRWKINGEIFEKMVEKSLKKIGDGGDLLGDGGDLLVMVEKLAEKSVNTFLHLTYVGAGDACASKSDKDLNKGLLVPVPANTALKCPVRANVLMKTVLKQARKLGRRDS